MLDDLSFNGNDWHNLEVEAGRYDVGGSLALELASDDDGFRESLVSVSANLPDVPLVHQNHIWVTNEAESDGVLSALEEIGVLKRTGSAV
ncbi:MAG TPA: hypothetical protein VGC57_09085 [Cellulomonas sp.]